MSLCDEFIKEYDDGNLKFNNIKYRKGALIGASLGLANGFKKNEDESLEWGYVRIHTGVDRNDGGVVDGIKDIVIVPFNFERSKFKDYNGEIYGSLISLFSDKYNFEFRIAHMRPNQILILNELKNNESIKKDTLIGPAGDYGLGAGAHTHTEVRSIGEKSDTLEELLFKKFGNEINKQYSEQEVIAYYKTMEKFKEANESEILKNWQELKSNRGCLFINKYLYRYRDYSENREITRYSTEHLWNGL